MMQANCFQRIEKFVSPKIDLRPESLPPLAMGYVFEDLLRRFNEATNAEAGRHFTPREIIELMTHLLFLPVKDKIQKGTFLVYDPCAGSGAMLTESKKYITDEEGEIKSRAKIHLYGQENTPTIYAISKSDMLLKGEDPDKIVFGSTLSQYGFDKDLKFDFMLTNPPYGTSWSDDKKALSVGPKNSIVDPRFKVGCSRINDGQLMFVLHMLSKMKDTELGSRIASVHNGSALFTGDAGSSESGIRRYIFENDLLEAVIALPLEIFYNTGQPTYILLFANVKAKSRKNKVQLIKADSFFRRMTKALGNKKNELTAEHINTIVELYLNNSDNEYSKILPNNEFGYYTLSVKHSKDDFKEGFNIKDVEFIPLTSNIENYIQTEIMKYTPNAKPDLNSVKIGYSINFLEYFHKANSYRDLEMVIKDIKRLEEKSNGLLNNLL